MQTKIYDVLVKSVNREDIQKKLDSLFMNLFFPRPVTCETRDILLDNIDAPDIPVAAFCSPMVGNRVARDEGYVSKTITPGYMKPKAVLMPINSRFVRQIFHPNNSRHI